MTIPSRPAPAPPAARSSSAHYGTTAAAAGANASIEQLRLQLQQQQQQQTGSLQKLTIKLPPPPKAQHNNNNNNNGNYASSNNSSFSLSSTTSCSSSTHSSITRKFPQARYTPTTNWDDSPFSTNNGNGNGVGFKKVPPPRPPPPKVVVNHAHKVSNVTAATPIAQSTNILANIFHRKKSISSSSSNKTTTTAAAAKAATATRIYGVSSGSSNNSTCSTATTNGFTMTALGAAAPTNNAWATCSNWHMPATSTSNSNNMNATDAQLISFDSPPSSPTFTQKSNSDCLSVDSFSSDSNFSSPNNGSVSQPESGFEDDFNRSRPATTSPPAVADPWEAFDAIRPTARADYSSSSNNLAPVRNLSSIHQKSSNDNPLCNGKSLLPPAPCLNMPTIIKPKIAQKPKAPKPPMLLGARQQQQPPSPPMPHVAPPPPPPTTATAAGGFSLLDVISGKVDAIHLGTAADAGCYYAAEAPAQPYGIALFDFDGLEEGDLSFRENEKIYLLEQVSAEWYRGRTRSGCEGIFPINYIDIKVPLVASASSTSANEFTPTVAATQSTTYQQQQQQTHHQHQQQQRVRCLYNFPAEVEGDLALQEDELVTILYRINEDWLFGEVADGRRGQFPSNFLEYVPDNIARMP